MTQMAILKHFFWTVQKASKFDFNFYLNCRSCLIAHHLIVCFFFQFHRLLTSYNAYVIQAEFENTNQTDKSNKKTANGPQKTMISQSTLEDNKNIESKGSTEENVPNSLNPFVSEPDTVRSPSDNQQFLISRQPFRQVFADISETQKDAELKLQNRFSNTLIVHGLPIRGGDRNSLLGPFQILCDYLLEPVDLKEIENIEFDGEILTVTLYDKPKRNHLLAKCRRKKNLKSKDILKLLPGEFSMKVTMHVKETAFYKDLANLAQEYVFKKQLYCYQIRNEGLGIKLKKNMEFIYVRSQNELNQQIVCNEQKSKGGDCTSSAVQHTT